VVKFIIRFFWWTAVLIFLSGCSTAYYSAMEKMGKEKRHILIDKVEDVQESQTKAQEEFKDALTRIKELYSFDGGELETFYDKLKDSYEDCDSRAGQIEKRINNVEDVAEDLFAEWEAEIAQMNDVNLKNSSKRSLRDSKIKYQKNFMITLTTESFISIITPLKFTSCF